MVALPWALLGAGHGAPHERSPGGASSHSLAAALNVSDCAPWLVVEEVAVALADEPRSDLR